MIKFVIGGTATSNKKTVLWNGLVVLCESVEYNLVVNKVEYGLGFYCSRERTQERTDKHDDEYGDLRKTTTIDGKDQ